MRKSQKFQPESVSVCAHEILLDSTLRPARYICYRSRSGPPPDSSTVATPSFATRTPRNKWAPTGERNEEYPGRRSKKPTGCGCDLCIYVPRVSGVKLTLQYYVEVLTS
ncbi:hypothetical protein EVAR_65594_1 [Eumeta japonica]|uniref:Uncharacterized protein n=1 Tax=Eumeta variegata TaxID=151549 RepID=A0A4C2A3H3_EUMVA|nr:hypothetical protein EVAR_65594_1 [Eumeta japonica]